MTSGSKSRCTIAAADKCASTGRDQMQARRTVAAAAGMGAAGMAVAAAGTAVAAAGKAAAGTVVAAVEISKSQILFN